MSSINQSWIKDLILILVFPGGVVTGDFPPSLTGKVSEILFTVRFLVSNDEQ